MLCLNAKHLCRVGKAGVPSRRAARPRGRRRSSAGASRGFAGAGARWRTSPATSPPRPHRLDPCVDWRPPPALAGPSLRHRPSRANQRQTRVVVRVRWSVCALRRTFTRGGQYLGLEVVSCELLQRNGQLRSGSQRGHLCGQPRPDQPIVSARSFSIAIVRGWPRRAGP
jgi:hypothetical protein